MRNFSVFGSLILILSVIGIVVGYVVVFSQFDYMWFNFTALFILCVITFVGGLGIVASAFLNGAKDLES